MIAASPVRMAFPARMSRSPRIHLRYNCILPDFFPKDIHKKNRLEAGFLYLTFQLKTNS